MELIRTTTEGKILFLCHEILVLMDCSLEGSVTKSSCPGWVGLSWILTAANHLLCRAEDFTLQSVLVLGRSSSEPDSDGGGVDGLSKRCVFVHHHQLWQVELFQLLQEGHPVLDFLDEGADVQPHLRSWVRMEGRKQNDSTEPTGCSVSIKSPDGQSPTCRWTRTPHLLFVWGLLKHRHRVVKFLDLNLFYSISIPRKILGTRYHFRYHGAKMANS